MTSNDGFFRIFPASYCDKNYLSCFVVESLKAYSITISILLSLRCLPRWVSFALAPALLSVPTVIPIDLSVARWFSACISFVSFLTAFHIFVTLPTKAGIMSRPKQTPDDVTKHSQNKGKSSFSLKAEETSLWDYNTVMSENWRIYILRNCHLQWKGTNAFLPFFLKRVLNALFKLLLANLILLQKETCISSWNEEDPKSCSISSIVGIGSLNICTARRAIIHYFDAFVLFFVANGLSEGPLLFWASAAKVEMQEMFDKPYIATTFREFWGRRWNLLVSNMLKQCVYYPLGGNKSSTMATFFTFVVSGLFHEYVNYMTGMPPLKNFYFFLANGVALLLERKFYRQWKALVPGAIRWGIVLGCLLLMAPQFFQPYVAIGYMEQVLKMLPLTSTQVLFLPSLCTT